ncbi:glycosyltransferase [bacterium]|nr:glycosyltransferase [bacterium]
MIKLSVIIIGRNEEAHIEACLRSVIKGIRTISDTEIIYADSASTDNTLQIVRQYPASVYQLKPEWPLSAAAGRYIGYLHAKGSYLFFIDGDTVLYHDWLPKGIRYLQTHSDTGAVAGTVHELFEDDYGKPISLQRHRYGRLENPRTEKTLGGIALYRRSVLEQAGPFNPYIPVDEERELGLRIRRAGFSLVRISDLMAVTYGPSRETWGELKRRYYSGLYTFGTTLQYCRRNGFFWQYMFERMGMIISFLFALAAAGAVCAVSVLYGWFFILLFGSAAVILVLKLTRPRFFDRVFISLIKRTLMTVSTIQSFIQSRPRMIEEYPVAADHVEKDERS